MDQRNTPLFNALLHYLEQNTLPFHSPAHKQGVGLAGPFRDFVGSNVLAIDLTVLPDLDFLSAPRGPIKRAQELAAAAYAADHAFFLINGTSGGIHAMIMAAVGPGDKMLVPRNVHKSVFAGLVLSGGVPIYIEPEYDDRFGIPLQITPQQVERAFDEHPDLKAVFVVNPTYYGIATYLRSIVEIAHSHGVPVLVDEAHGAHLIFNEALPESAMEAGADISAISVHKVAGSMTQSSLLVMREGLLDYDRVQEVLNYLQSTSPSFVLMASLDVARSNIAVHGDRLIKQAVALADEVRRRINEIPGFYAFGQEVVERGSVAAIDPTKITIRTVDLGLTGFEVEAILNREFDIAIELSGEHYILIPITIGDRRDRVERFLSALSRLAHRFGKPEAGARFSDSVRPPRVPPMVVTPRDAVFSMREIVPISRAAGRVSAETVTVYPPGIPIVCSGELITQEVLDYVDSLNRETTLLQGMSDPSLLTVQVLTEPGPGQNG